MTSSLPIFHVPVRINEFQDSLVIDEAKKLIYQIELMMQRLKITEQTYIDVIDKVKVGDEPIELRVNHLQADIRSSGSLAVSGRAFELQCVHVQVRNVFRHRGRHAVSADENDTVRAFVIRADYAASALSS